MAEALSKADNKTKDYSRSLIQKHTVHVQAATTWLNAVPQCSSIETSSTWLNAVHQ